MLSWLFSHYFEELPDLKICLSEGNIGWMPYFLERAEQVLDKQRAWAKKGALQGYAHGWGLDDAGPAREADLDKLDIRATFRDHIYGCFIEETAGIRCLDMIGEDNVMLEVDYPHTDTNWPNSLQTVRGIIGHLPPETQAKLLRTNAEKLFRFTAAVPDLVGIQA
jgi:predicted TIM-barrel fold metal-dependent hydrolase